MEPYVRQNLPRQGPRGRRQWVRPGWRFRREPASFGDNAGEALADLLKRIRSEETTIWVPRAAKQYREGEVLKCACPECGHISVMSECDEVIAYVCGACGAGVDVEPIGVA